MFIDTKLFHDRQFKHLTIANFRDFQIVVPTMTKMVEKQILSARVSVPEKIYDPQGWLISQGKIVAYIKGLEVGSVFSERSPFEPVRRINPSIPVSFEVESTNSLPTEVLRQAAFACQFEDEVFSYHALFKNVVPRFAKIYSFDTNNSVLDRVKQMLQAETMFITQNYERLRRVPFYQKNFGL